MVNVPSRVSHPARPFFPEYQVMMIQIKPTFTPGTFLFSPFAPRPLADMYVFLTHGIENRVRFPETRE